MITYIVTCNLLREKQNSQILERDGQLTKIGDGRKVPISNNKTGKKKS